MGKKYIINFEDNPGIAPNREKYYKCCEIPWWVAAECTLSKLTPYTEPDMEQVRKEAYDKGYDDATAEIGSDEQEIAEKAYQKGLSDAWDAARKIANIPYSEEEKVFGSGGWTFIINHTASEAIEKIRAYEQEKEEPKKEQSFTAEEVMRQYLETFCHGRSCMSCPLNAPNFTCGRGYHFITNPVSDEEVRRAYTIVLQKMKEN